MSQNQGRNTLVIGRLVWTVGSLFEGKTKTIFGTQTPALNKQGEQSKQFGFGLAVPKAVLGQMADGQPGEFWRIMHEEAYTMFPNKQIPPSFAMKWKDGDGVDDKGIPFAQREGHAGHIILSCTTERPIMFFKWDAQAGKHERIGDGIKCGDYVQVSLNIKAHPAMGQGKAGLYLNPNAVQWAGYGKEIVNAPSGDQIFGNALPPLPPGASATPLVSSTPMPAGMPMPGGTPAPYTPPMPQAAAPVVPNYGVLPANHQPQGTPVMPTYTPPPQGGFPQMNPPNGFPGLPTP